MTRIPKKNLKRTLMKKGKQKVYINVIKIMYEGASSRVKSVIGETEYICIRVAYQFYLFLMVIKEIIKNIQSEVS